MQTTLQMPAPNESSQNVSNMEVTVNYTGRQKIILEAAHFLISEKGIKLATITQIAKRAGVADSVIYHYFKNKEDVVLSVLNMQLLNALEDLSYHFKGIAGPVSKLGKMLWYHLSMNDQGDAQMRKNMLLECRSYRNFPEHTSYQTLQAYVGILDTILIQGIEEGFFDPTINVPLVRTVILGLVDEGALIDSSSNSPSNTLSDFDHIMDLVIAMTEKPVATSDSNNKPDKYNRILLVAKQLYAEKGFKNTTVAEVAHLSGVAEGTIYEYFKNKQDLLLCITREYFGKLKTDLDDAFTMKVDNPTEQLRWLMWHHFKIFGADRDLVTVFLKDTKLKKYFYKDEAHKSFFHYHDKICEVLNEGKESGMFRAEINTRVFRNLVMGSLAGVYTRWYFRTPVYALDYMTELHQYINLICRAASFHPRPPKKQFPGW